MLALWRGECPWPAPEVLDLIDDPDEHVRAYVVIVAPELVGPAAVDPLIKALQDSFARFRGRACGSLAHTGDRRALPELRPMVKDPDSTVRTSACYALGELSDTDSLPSLLHIAETDEDVDARYEAARALHRLGHPRGRELLQKMIEDGESLDYLLVSVFHEEVREVIEREGGERAGAVN